MKRGRRNRQKTRRSKKVLLDALHIEVFVSPDLSDHKARQIRNIAEQVLLSAATLIETIVRISAGTDVVVRIGS